MMILAGFFFKSDYYYYYYFFFSQYYCHFLLFTSKIKVLIFILMCVHSRERDSSSGFVGV